MKKITLLFALLISIGVSAQTKSINLIKYNPTTMLWQVDYTNEIGGLATANMYSFTDTSLANAVKAKALSIIDTIPKVINPLKSILLTGTNSTNGIFTISGQYLFPIQLKTSQLTGNNATIKTNFYNFVQQAIGQPLTSLVANFDGSDSIYINGIKMNSGHADSLSGGLVSQAKQMCLDLLNGAQP